MFDVSSLTENPVNLAIVIAVVVAIGYILFRVARSVLKLVLTLAVIGLAYYFWQGGTVQGLKDKGTQAIFKEANLSNMKAMHCEGDEAARSKCVCIIDPVYIDIHSRLSDSEIAEINQDPQRVEAELQLSMRNKRSEIRSCLVSNQGGKIWDQVRDVLDGN